MDEKEKLRRKAIEIFLSGRKNPGAENPWTKPREKLTEKEREFIDSLDAPTSTKDMKIRGKKKGQRTPRQTFRCDEALWKQFQAATRRKESKTASEILRRFIYNYTHGGK